MYRLIFSFLVLALCGCVSPNRIPDPLVVLSDGSSVPQSHARACYPYTIQAAYGTEDRRQEAYLKCAHGIWSPANASAYLRGIPSARTASYEASTRGPLSEPMAGWKGGVLFDRYGNPRPDAPPRDEVYRGLSEALKEFNAYENQQTLPAPSRPADIERIRSLERQLNLADEEVLVTPAAG